MTSIDEQIREKEIQLEGLREIKRAEERSLRSRIAKIVVLDVDLSNVIISDHRTYWCTGILLTFPNSISTWNLAERIIKAGYYISQIYTVGDEEMRWIITEYEEPARETRA